MVDTIYVEEEVLEHPRAKLIISKFPLARIIEIDRFGEVFNKRDQNFKIQKINPAIILAKKYKKLILPAPDGFGIGGKRNYYFSHMYNCIYDCRYCFLQGMYSSANYVIFINFEDFAEQIIQINKEFSKDNITFFSGYDCDSLALENITGFLDYILPIFSPYPKSMLEVRTKSAKLKPMTIVSPPDNCIIAYSLMPEIMSRVLDHKAPSIDRRIKSMTDLANRGWKIGLRFDPLIYGKNWKELYTELIESISKNIPSEAIHSISFGPLRFPRAMFQKIFKLYPDDILFTGPITQRGSIMAYSEEIENEMALHCRQLFSNFVSDSIIFQCVSEGSSNLSDQV